MVKPVSSVACCIEATSSTLRPLAVIPAEFSFSSPPSAANSSAPSGISADFLSCTPSSITELGLPALGAKNMKSPIVRTKQAATIEAVKPRIRGRVINFLFLASCILIIFLSFSILSFSLISFTAFSLSTFCSSFFW